MREKRLGAGTRGTSASLAGLSTFTLNDVLQGIQGPSNAIAHMRLRFLEGLDAGLGAFELKAQGVALALERHQLVSRTERLGRF